HVLLRAELRVPQHATADLVGARVIETVPRGKHLLTRLERDDDRWTLHTHLKMEGIWRIYRDGRRWDRPAFQARVVLGVEGTEAVGFSLGTVELLHTAAEDSAVGHLGPDLLGTDWDPDEAVRRIGQDPQRPIKEALLDQRNLAGIGNVYVAELLFLAGEHPLTPVEDVVALGRLVRRAYQALDLNKDRTTRTLTGNLRAPLWVYGRDGAPCRRCRTRVLTAEQGLPGKERVSYWCPHCQPARG
ncbi:MAG: DNA-formamidopyrimidine glycosylase family protein, partial [Nocardioides sp.]